MDEKFGKKYKLCSKIKIEEIFKSDLSVKKFPFLIRYIQTDLETDTNFQIVISVPKRKFKKAVDRNRIKRLIREAVRKNKYILENAQIEENKKFALFLIYLSHQEETYQMIFERIEELFKRLIKDKT